ncbi:MAG: 30S ribosomal protein S16 [Bacteroidales bacterium]|jgi:small subunit ribosomal protein S16|nr:30S ribosomal protein S16 [Bacteroidales bacterium]
MAVKIRLARHGKKNFAFFHIVVADGRAPRDGRYIAKLGTYNPNTNPAVIELDTDGALKWLYNGAQPTDTCRRILSYKGVLLKKHLQEGVKKGALTQEVADQKWNDWASEKENKVSGKVSQLAQSTRDAKKAAAAEEAKVNEARAAELAKRKEDERKAAEAAAAAEAKTEAQAEVIEEKVEEVTPEAPVAEEAPEA